MRCNIHTNPFFHLLRLALFLIISPTFAFSQANIKIDSTASDSISLNVLTSKDGLNDKLEYKATDSIQFDYSHNVVFLYGKAEVYYQDITLKSEIIQIQIDSNIVTAKGTVDSTGNNIGEPIMNDAGKEFKAHQIKYNFKTKKGIITEVTTHEGDSYIHGKKIYKTPDNTIYIKNGKYTTCNLDHPHYYFAASKIKIIPHDKIITGPADLVIVDVPTPIAIPFGFFPNTNKQKSGLIIPTPGESTQYGYFLLNGGYYWGISDKLNLQLTGDFYSKGSWGANMLTSYKNRYHYSGNFSARFSNFKNGDPEFPGFSQNKDFFLRWNHTQDPKARPNSIFSANVNFGTSKNFQNNFNSTGADYLSTSFNSSVSYRKSWQGKPFNLSVNGYHSQNVLNKTITVRLPEVAFNISRIYPFKRKITVGKQKFYENIGISYSMNTKNEVTAQDSLFSSRNLNQLSQEFKNGMKHVIPISTSIKLLKYFTLNPSASFTDIWYLNSVRKNWDSKTNSLKTDTVIGFTTGYSYLFSGSLSTKIYGMYLYKGKMIKALRHVMTPSIGFSFVPENNSGYRFYTDTNNIKTYYSIFENGIYGSTNQVKASLITFGLLNNFEMKVRNRKDSLSQDKKIKLLENLSFNTSYNLVADSLNWAPVSISARTNIFKKLSLNFSGTVDPYALDSNGIKINTSEFKVHNSVGRLTSANLALGFSLKSKNSNYKEKTSKYATEAEMEYINANPQDFVDFNVPWNLNFSYNVRYSKPQFKSSIIQTLNFSGDFSLTEKWKIGFTSGYDFEMKDLSYTTIDFYRDLHCWEMTFNWVPIGPRQSYLFTIRVKSAVLQDLKLTRRNLPNVF